MSDMRDMIGQSMEGMPWSKVDTTHYHEHLGLSDKGRVNKGLLENRDVSALTINMTTVQKKYKTYPFYPWRF